MREATEIVVVMDKSASMGLIRNEAIEGFNGFLKEQKELPGEATLTLILFDHQYHVVYQRKPLAEVPELTTETYAPSGWTALLDAMGVAIDTTGAALGELKEEDRPNKVIIVVMTDGEENHSREYTREMIKEKVTHQEEKYDWAFMFLGANIDAITVGDLLGVAQATTSQFTADKGSIGSSYQGMSRGVGAYRSGGKASLNTGNWKKDIK